MTCSLRYSAAGKLRDSWGETIRIGSSFTLQFSISSPGRAVPYNKSTRFVVIPTIMPTSKLNHRQIISVTTNGIRSSSGKVRI